MKTRRVTADIHVLASEFPAPGLGVLPINAYLIKAREPVLIDTGQPRDAGTLLSALEAVIDAQDLRWVYLTHSDPDHIGALAEVMKSAPRSRLVTTYLGLGTLSLATDVAMDRVYFLNPGEELDVGDRRLRAVRPPTFDRPATTGLFDHNSRVFFSSDSFGAVLPEACEEAGDLSEEVLRNGQVLWTTVDSPWLHKVDRRVFAEDLDAVRRMAPEWVLSVHLPPARSMTGWMLESLAAAPDSPPFVGPNQAAFDAMLGAQATA